MTTITIPAAAPPSVRRPILQLAAIECWRLVRHPAFIAGLLGAVLHLWQATVRDEEWAGQSYFIAITVGGWLWTGTFIAAAAVAGRNRWLDDADLFPGTPIAQTGRLTGLLIALTGPVTIAAAGAAGAAIWFNRRGGFDLGDPGWTSPLDPPLVQWLQLPVLTALAGVAGVAVTQLRRKRLLAVGLLALITWVAGLAPWLFAAYPFRVLQPFMYPAYEWQLPSDYSLESWGPGDPPLLGPGEFAWFWRAVRFDSTALWWHLGYVVGLALLLVWAATRLADRSTSRRSLLLAGFLVVVACGAGQLITAGHNP